MDNLNIQLFLFFIGFRQYIHVAVNRDIRGTMLRKCASDKWKPVCWICEQPVKNRKQRSADHLIPVSYCWVLGWYRLVVDPRNIVVAHKKCNLKRSNSLDGLPPAVVEKIHKLLPEGLPI